MKGTVHYEVKEGVALLTVDNPPVNPLSDGVRAGFVDNITKAENDPDVIGVVLTGAGRSFIAGADISEFGKKPDGPGLEEAFRKLEFCSKPVVAAINSSALGGGLETAIVCK